MRESLTYVHAGAFSGSAHSLRSALAAEVDVRAVDLMPMARRPSLAIPRLRGMLEARGAGRAPWTKTSAWVKGLQGHLARSGALDPARPALVVQTLPALDLTGFRYGIYTDRVGREGARVGGPHASTFSAGWLDRETRFVRGAHRVFVMGPSTRTVLVEDYGCDPERVEVVGAGPNTVLHRGPARRTCRRLLFVGTQWDLKGGPILLEAFARLRERHPDLELTLVGSAPPDELPAGVRALGRVPHEDMDAVYGAADVLVIPTHMEAFGVALLEALITGLPCVCSTVGNQQWIIGDAGVAVPPADPDALVAALQRVIDDYPAFQARATARGSVLGESMSWPAVAHRIVAALVTT